MAYLATGNIELSEESLQALAGGDGFGVGRISSDGLLDERRIAHVEQLVRMSQFPSGFAGIPVSPKLHENGFTRVPRLAFENRREASAIDRHTFRQLAASEFGDRWKKVGKICEVL